MVVWAVAVSRDLPPFIEHGADPNRGGSRGPPHRPLAWFRPLASPCGLAPWPGLPPLDLSQVKKMTLGYLKKKDKVRKTSLSCCFGD